MYIQAVVHFVVTQCRPLLIFYIGLRSHLAYLANWSFTHTAWSAEFEETQRNFRSGDLSRIMHLGRYLDCILSSSYFVLWTFASNYEANCVGPVESAWSGYGLPIALNQILAGFNIIGLLMVIVFLLVLQAEFFRSKVRDFGDASYLSFTYRVQKSRPYKLMSTILVLYAFLMLADMGRSLYTIYRSEPGVFINFIEYMLPGMLTLVYSAVTLAKGSKDPFFDYESDEFINLQFARSWSSVLVDNNDFAWQLSVALLKAKYNETQDLEDLLPRGADMEEVIWACKPMSSEENPDLETTSATTCSGDTTHRSLILDEQVSCCGGKQKRLNSTDGDGGSYATLVGEQQGQQFGEE